MKKRIILTCFCIFGLALSGTLIYYAVFRGNGDADATTNEVFNFKQHYEALNNTPAAFNPELIFKEMYIPESNPFRLAEFDEINQLIKRGTGIIYLGFPICPWCRNLVPVLANAAIGFGVSEILYRDILEDRNILELEEGEIVETRAGKPGYYRLLALLGDIAPVYAGLEDDTIRRVYVPAVIFVRNGEIIGYITGLDSFRDRVSDEALGGWLPMNEAEEDELFQLFMQYFRLTFEPQPAPTPSPGADDDACPLC